MSQQLINRSHDLKKLRDEGYEVQVCGGYLIIHHIPYLNSKREIAFGKLISTLSMNNDVTIKPDTHVIYFMGEHPCNKDGTIIAAIHHGHVNQILFDGLVMNFSFSNKPPEGYSDYYQKASRYADIISAPVQSTDPLISAKTFKVVVDSNDESVFKYIDTNSSRANIFFLNSRFSDQKVGIIGLGGTGSYILDLVAKTPVCEIHLFDGDLFLQHNAFRSPGAPSVEILNRRLKKADYFAEIYSSMHKGIKSFPVFITEDNVGLLERLSFVFVCVDNNRIRAKILSKLRQFGIPFIDVGLGVNMAEESLIGTIRMTVGLPSKMDHISARIGTEDSEDDIYATNIQIADLNAMNATMAVIKWKKIIGIYQDLKEEHNATYTLNTAQMINGDFKS